MFNALGKLTGSHGSEDCWFPGGRYEVRQRCPILSSTKSVTSQVSELKPRDQVLLLAVKSQESSEEANFMGFVQPANAKHGWINLDSTCIRRERLEGSWCIKARYRVCNPCKVRAGKSIASPVKCSVAAGDEVLVLDLGVDCDHESNKARLRAQVQILESEVLVARNRMVVGWLSPEPRAGLRLLDPLDLLGTDIIKLHQMNLKGKGPGCSRSLEDGHAAWQVDCQYRVLENQPLREESDLASKEKGNVQAGTLVTVKERTSVHSPTLGRCPCALVSVDDGVLQHQEGWLRCVAEEGHHLINNRDQLAYDKAIVQLRPRVKSAGPEDIIEATWVPDGDLLDAIEEFGAIERDTDNAREDDDYNWCIHEDAEGGACNIGPMESAYDIKLGRGLYLEPDPAKKDEYTMEDPTPWQASVDELQQEQYTSNGGSWFCGCSPAAGPAPRPRRPL